MKKLKLNIPTRWKIGLPMFALVLAGLLVLKKNRTAFEFQPEMMISSSVRLSKSLLPTGTARDWNVALGVRLAKGKHFGAAKKVFEELLQVEPTNATVLNNLAFVVAEQGDIAKALEYLAKATAASDTCAECFNNLGTLLMKQEKRAEAKGAFERATRIDGNYADAKLNLAMLLEEEADWQGAMESYRVAAELIQDPQVKRWVSSRASWMSEISQNAKRQISGEKK